MLHLLKTIWSFVLNWVPTIAWPLLGQFKAQGELYCPNPSIFKTQENTLLECGLVVKKWV